MKHRRRTLKAYTELYRNPRSLFPPTADSNGVSVTLFPNGERAIWIQDDTGKGFAITAGRGPHGLGLQIRRFVGAPPMTLSANGLGQDMLHKFDATHLEVCQYDATETAQAFKAWYGKDKTAV